MGKKNKKEFEEQVNEVVENESLQIDLEEVPEEEKLMTEEEIVAQEEYLEEVPEIEPMPEVVEEPQEEQCSCTGDCPCNEEIKPVEVKVEAPKKLTVEQQRNFLRTGRLPK